VAPLYLFCFIDRANIGNARLAGFEKDLGLKGYDYNRVLTMFYSMLIPQAWKKIALSTLAPLWDHELLYMAGQL
jgi:hypothetical protein